MRATSGPPRPNGFLSGTICRAGGLKVRVEATDGFGHVAPAEADAKMGVAEFELGARQQQDAASAHDVVAKSCGAFGAAIANKSDRAGTRPLPTEERVVPLEKRIEDAKICRDDLETSPVERLAVAQ